MFTWWPSPYLMTLTLWRASQLLWGIGQSVPDIYPIMQLECRQCCTNGRTLLMDCAGIAWRCCPFDVGLQNVTGILHVKETQLLQLKAISTKMVAFLMRKHMGNINTKVSEKYLHWSTQDMSHLRYQSWSKFMYLPCSVGGICSGDRRQTNGCPNRLGQCWNIQN